MIYWSYIYGNTVNYYLEIIPCISIDLLPDRMNTGYVIAGLNEVTGIKTRISHASLGKHRIVGNTTKFDLIFYIPQNKNKNKNSIQWNRAARAHSKPSSLSLYSLERKQD